MEYHSLGPTLPLLKPAKQEGAKSKVSPTFSNPVFVFLFVFHYRISILSH
jgi:hypothetical protein